MMSASLMKFFVLISSSAFLISAVPATDARQILLDAMNTELSRNQTELKLSGHEPPYFISYQLKDYRQHEIAARFGALFQEESPHDRKVFVDVRVGSYEFDNSLGEDMDFNFSMKGNSYISRKNGPIDDDPIALRTALWLITDEKYKGALFNYLKKKGENVYTVDNPKRPPSFSREQANTYIQAPVPYSFDRARWTKVVRELSEMFNAAPRVFDSEVRVSADKVTRYFVSTEGGRIV